MSYGQYSENYKGKSNPLTPKTKRQREVFPSDEVPHLWAHQSQQRARNQQGNLYFDGPTIYSYGSHFPIATHVSKGRKRAILFTTRGYSNTTAKHLFAVRRAIPEGVQVFHVDLRSNSVGYDGSFRANHAEVLEVYRARIVEGIETVRRSRNGATWTLSTAMRTADEMRKYAKFFGVKVGKVPLPRKRELDALRAESIRKHDIAKERQAVRDRERARKWEEQKRLNALELPEKIEKWRAGESVQFWGQRVPTMLRVKGDEVETSLGARVPLGHAKRALPFVLKLHERGEEWRTNGHTIHLGVYTLDRIDADGVHAGCHHIGWDEVERFTNLIKSIPK
jgi:hypothetical protein